MKQLLSNRKFIIATLTLISIMLSFWIGSRYPDLNEKSGMASDRLIENAISFTSVFPISHDDSQLTVAFKHAINWIDNNKKGMIFGIILAATILTILPFIGRLKFKTRLGNTITGLFIGTPMGVCVNCVTPIAQSMNRGGVNLYTSMATLFSSPTLNIIVLSLLFTLLPFYIALAKLIFTLFFIIIILPLVLKFTESYSISKTPDYVANQTLPDDSLLTETTLYGDIYWFIKTLFINIIYVCRITLPWMLLAGILGAILVAFIPWDHFIGWLTTLTSIEKVFGLIITTIFGLILPVPIAFDVLLGAVLYEVGLPVIYVTALVISLGTFSIYPFTIIGRDISWKIATLISVTLAILIFITSVATHYVSIEYKKSIMLAFTDIINTLDKPKDDSQYIPPFKNIELKSYQPISYSEVGFYNSRSIYIEKSPFQIPSINNTDTGFTNLSGQKLGLDDQLDHTNHLLLEIPYKHVRPIAAGDIQNDGWTDLLIKDTYNLSLYINDGGIRFHQHKISLSKHLLDSITTLALVDLNNDNHLDIFIGSITHGLYWLQNTGDRLLEPLPLLPDNQYPNYIMTSAFSDLDNNGLLDVIIGNYWTWRWSSNNYPAEIKNGVNQVAWARQDGYSIQELPGTTGSTLTTLVMDINHDGLDDILIGNDFDWPDTYLLNQGNQQFSSIKKQSKIIPKTTYFTMSLDSADINNDLVPEIFSANITSRNSDQRQADKNDIPLNDYCKTFTSAEMIAQCDRRLTLRKAAYNKTPGLNSCKTLLSPEDKTTCLRWRLKKELKLIRKHNECKQLFKEDINAIQTENLCSTQSRSLKAEYKKYLADQAPDNLPQQVQKERVNNLFQYSNNRYVDIAKNANVDFSGWAWNSKFSDFNNDGWQDLFIANGHFGRTFREPNYYYLNNKDGTFSDNTLTSGLVDYSPTGSSLNLDYDNDGDIDIITVPFNSEVAFYQNNSNDNNAISFELQDNIGNSKGVGSAIIIMHGSDQQIRHIKASGGYQSHDAPIAHFGLGKHAAVDSITIRWPDQAKTLLKGPFLAGFQYRIHRTDKTTDNN